MLVVLWGGPTNAHESEDVIRSLFGFADRFGMVNDDMNMRHHANRLVCGCVAGSKECRGIIEEDCFEEALLLHVPCIKT